MNKITKVLTSVMAVALTAVVTIMPRFTCFFILHQPEMPEELNDFRKYDK